jgi:hypothetical protein
MDTKGHQLVSFVRRPKHNAQCVPLCIHVFNNTGNRHRLIMGKVTYLLTDVPPYSSAKFFENDSAADLSAGIVAGLIRAPFFRYINEL